MGFWFFGPWLLGMVAIALAIVISAFWLFEYLWFRHVKPKSGGKVCL